jgi:hypothetical protein
MTHYQKRMIRDVAVGDCISHGDARGDPAKLIYKTIRSIGSGNGGVTQFVIAYLGPMAMILFEDNDTAAIYPLSCWVFVKKSPNQMLEKP